MGRSHQCIHPTRVASFPPFLPKIPGAYGYRNPKSLQEVIRLLWPVYAHLPAPAPADHDHDFRLVGSWRRHESRTL